MPTSVYNLPFPSDSDSPNGPQQIEDLAQAVEDTLQGDLELGGALDVPTTLETGGAATVQGALTVASVVNFTHSRMRPKHALNDTDVTGVSSSTPAPGTPVVGLTFEAPPSGWVYVTVTGRVRSDFFGNVALLGWELRDGGTIGSGTVIVAANANRAVATSGAIDAGSLPQIVASNRYLHAAGLTPGSLYNVRTMHWSSINGTGSSYLYRAILVEPVI